MSACPTCQAYEDAIRRAAQVDYRRKMELWTAYEAHRRECHHVLHIATVHPPHPQRVKNIDS